MQCSAAYGEVTSAQPALLAQPVLLTGDVTNISLVVDSQQVDLHWRLPGHVDEVVVVRTSDAPPYFLSRWYSSDLDG